MIYCMYYIDCTCNEICTRSKKQQLIRGFFLDLCQIYLASFIYEVECDQIFNLAQVPQMSLQ